MKVGLGTVQFGLDYGVSNCSGKISYEESEKIVASARCEGVNVIDTAQVYGDSENVLGKIGVEDFRVITKITNKGELQDSLEKLKLDSVYGLLAHNAEELINSNELWERFIGYKEQGVVEKIGVSVYNSEQVDKILNKYNIDIIQLPINIYDQRLLQSGHLKKLKDRGVEIHARSVFLQGLLLMDYSELPEYFAPIREVFRCYEEYLDVCCISKIEAALGFVCSLDVIDSVVCGVNNVKQFEELLTIKRDISKLDFSAFAIAESGIIDPSKWRF